MFLQFIFLLIINFIGHVCEEQQFRGIWFNCGQMGLAWMGIITARTSWAKRPFTKLYDFVTLIGHH